MQIQWYPGHMARAKRLLGDQLKRVDVVIELCDARLPYSSRNPELISLARGKRRLLILGKADLADGAATSRWLSYFAAHNQEAMAYDASRGKAKEALKRIEKLTAPLVEKQAARGVKKTVRCMVVGVPNVGKSTFINRLNGTPVAVVGDRPGVTRSNQWVRISPYLELLDTPGLLWPRLDDKLAAQHLAWLGTIRDQILDTEALAASLLEAMLQTRSDAVIDRFHLKQPLPETPELLEAVCRGRGFLLSGGVLDTERAASIVLDEFRAGKLGRLTLEEAPCEKQQPSD